MSSVDRHPSGTRMKRVEAAPELCIVVGCHTFVCAIPTRLVLRLALGDDIEEVGDSLIRANGEWFVRANLGELLGLRPLEGAWALLRLPHRGRDVTIALRTGACLSVRNVTVEAPLPGGLFEQRADAVLGAFVAERDGLRDAIYGVVLNVQALFSAAELAAAEGALARVERNGHV
jgi:hypothetical protein